MFGHASTSATLLNPPWLGGRAFAVQLGTSSPPLSWDQVEFKGNADQRALSHLPAFLVSDWLILLFILTVFFSLNKSIVKVAVHTHVFKYCCGLLLSIGHWAGVTLYPCGWVILQYFFSWFQSTCCGPWCFRSCFFLLPEAGFAVPCHKLQTRRLFQCALLHVAALGSPTAQFH